MEIKLEIEPGQELLSQKSSHERNDESSHELQTKDHESDQNSFKDFENPGNDGDNRKLSSRRLKIPALPISTTSYEFIGDLTNTKGEAFLIDGSRYEGTWDSLGMAGVGSYRMPHEVLYVGEMRDGMQHGKGSLEYPGKQVIDGVWNRGELKKWKYTFSDGLIFSTENWTYCEFPDRRFYQSKVNGLNPAGRSLKTQHQPTKVIPLGCYDSGDGIFDPSTLCVTNFEQPSRIIRIPSAKECQWIMTNCRKGGTEPTGYRPRLNENWSSIPPKLPYRLPMSNDSPERWWRRIFTFEKDTSVILNEMRRRLEKGEDGFSGSSRTDQRHTECGCLSEGSQRESVITSYDVCGEVEVCGDQSFNKEFDILREVVCEEMSDSDQEYEGESLLMTVCRPPEARIITRRRRRSRSTIKSLSSEGKEEELDKEEEEDEEKEEEGVQEEEKYEEKEEVDESTKESETDYWDETEDQLEKNFITQELEELEMEGEYHFDDFILSDKILREKSMKGEYDLGSLIERISKDFNELMQSKRRSSPTKRKPEGVAAKGKPEGDPAKRKSERAGRSRKSKTVKIVQKKQIFAQKKRPCPIVDDTEQLLQRKVGDLLFSPALDAPRSPVYLVRKVCDKKLCAKCKTEPQKYYASKCAGSSLSPTNFSFKRKKRVRANVCKDEDKKLTNNLNSEMKNICSSLKPFNSI